MRRLLTLAIVALALPACADETAADAAASPAAPIADAPATAASAADLDALVADPTPARLLALLSQDHRAARRALGPHRIEHRADLSLLPPADLPRPRVDQPAPAPQVVHDELLLEWAGADDRDLRLRLRQGPSDAAARELVIVGEVVATRLPYRGYVRRDLDSDIHWLWLDDAFHSVHDLVQLAAPNLVVQISGDADGQVHLTLSRRDIADRAAIADGYGREWRRSVELTAIDGTLSLDRRGGIWRRADLRVAYTARDQTGGLLRGEATLRATLTPDPALQVELPPLSDPLPTRPRYDDERRRLLDGLAR